MLQWNNQTKIDAPVNAGALAQGVKVTFSGSTETNNPFVAFLRLLLLAQLFLPPIPINPASGLAKIVNL